MSSCKTSGAYYDVYYLRSIIADQILPISYCRSVRAGQHDANTAVLWWIANAAPLPATRSQPAWLS
ncbi:hypothetical protein N9L80_03545 [Luminiphilus sp.]|nr:hypothetical protein [Luminiphilus sp.]